MISHAACDHESTSGARAKCRRAMSSGDAGPGKRTKASTKEVDFSGSGGAESHTPGWKADECHVCGIEKSEFQGTDSWTKLFVLVGAKCAWRVKRSDDFAAMTARR